MMSSASRSSSNAFEGGWWTNCFGFNRAGNDAVPAVPAVQESVDAGILAATDAQLPAQQVRGCPGASGLAVYGLANGL